MRECDDETRAADARAREQSEGERVQMRERDRDARRTRRTVRGASAIDGGFLSAMAKGSLLIRTTCLFFQAWATSTFSEVRAFLEVPGD